MHRIKYLAAAIAFALAGCTSAPSKPSAALSYVTPDYAQKAP